jgi:hypothetical protein
MQLSENLKLKGLWTFTSVDQNGEILKVQKYENLIVNLGKYVVARLLAGDVTYTGEINRMALGTGTNSPAATDTKLQAEIFRDTYQTRSRTNNVLELEYYVGISEANGTLKEAGLFIDGTGAADSGQLFNRVNIDVTKTASISLIVNVQITIV